MCDNDLQSSPNPILESPMGLLILYDEIVFLCRSLCPDNMRALPYVKYVDCVFPDLVLSQIQEASWETGKKLNSFLTESCSWTALRHSMNLDSDGFAVDNHSHAIRIADITTSAHYSRIIKTISKGVVFIISPSFRRLFRRSSYLRYNQYKHCGFVSHYLQLDWSEVTQTTVTCLNW